ncbi:EF hand domain-containing protein [Sphingomonas sp. F9_3S_D5_B_2]
MLRFLAGAAAAFLLLTGAFLMWQSHAAQPTSALPDAPAPRAAAGAPALLAASVPFEPPQATAATREEKRFSRADKNKDGKIESEEIFAPRRKAFAKLDVNGNGALSFEEWAARSIQKFKGADADRTGWLTAAEYATTAPPAPKRKRCSC